MKANGACKIIGHAFEDANVGDLKAQNAVLDTCLNEIEQALSGQAPTQSATLRDVVLFGAWLVVGLVVGRRVNKGASQ